MPLNMITPLNRRPGRHCLPSPAGYRAPWNVSVVEIFVAKVGGNRRGGSTIDCVDKKLTKHCLWGWILHLGHPHRSQGAVKCSPGSHAANQSTFQGRFFLACN